MIEDVTFDIPAGVTLPVSVSGNFVRVLAINAGKKVTVKTHEGLSVPMGLAQKMRAGGYEKLLLHNPDAAGITVTLLVGFGDFDDQEIAGTVTVDDSTPIDINVTNNPTVQAITDPVSIDNYGIGDTDFYINGSATSLQTLVAPASNTNGIVIYSISLQVGSGQLGRLMSKTSAPSGYTDTSAHGIAAMTASYNSQFARPLPLLIPAGQGLYFQCSGSAVCNVNYEVL